LSDYPTTQELSNQRRERAVCFASASYNLIRATMSLYRRDAVITLLAALGLAVIAYIGAFVSGVPTIFSPLPALTVIPALLLSRPPLDYAVVLIPTLLFLAWNPQLMRHESKIPKRTYALFGVLAVLSILYLAASWKW
jgi:hypothetical protein